MPTKIFYKFLDDQSLLKRLLTSSSPSGAWAEFLRRYSYLFFKVIWEHEQDHDAAVEKYLFVCTKLAENNFARLRKFRTEFGTRSPKLSTWLVAVTHNLCIDAHRATHGRRRFPAAVAEMPETSRTVFRLYFWEGRSIEEIHHLLNGRMNNQTVSEILDDIENAIGEQRRAPTPELVPFEPERHSPVRMETVYETSPEDSEWLSVLDARERIVVRLRFWEDLSAKEIVGILNLHSTQQVHTIMHRALKKLRARASALKSTTQNVRDIQAGQKKNASH